LYCPIAFLLIMCYFWYVCFPQIIENPVATGLSTSSIYLDFDKENPGGNERNGCWHSYLFVLELR
jgi:hypothetical protein